MVSTFDYTVLMFCVQNMQKMIAGIFKAGEFESIWLKKKNEDGNTCTCWGFVKSESKKKVY